MNESIVIQKTAAFVEEKFNQESTGHDWWHIYRVWQLAKTIGLGQKNADMFIVELAALLHDIADWKFHDGDMTAGPREATRWLKSIAVEQSVITHIEDIIFTVSFKGAGVNSDMKTIEGKIIHDADKLDAMGAIGIARAFAYGGANGRLLYDPNVKPEHHTDFASYKNSKGSSLNHFYEKLLLLKDRMYTDTGQQLAIHRHRYLEDYLEEFKKEWGGEL